MNNFEENKRTEEEFVGEVKGKLEERGFEVRINEITKINTPPYTGLSINKKEEDKSISKIYNMSYLYEKYENNLDELIQFILKDYCDCPEDLENFSFLNYPAIKEHLLLRVCDYESNKEILTEMPHTIVAGDLALYICINLSQEIKSFDGNAMASVKVTNHLMNIWSITKEQLFADASKASEEKFPAVICDIITAMSVLSEASELSYQPVKDFKFQTDMATEVMRVPFCIPLYTLTNPSLVNGAAVLFYEDTCTLLSEAFGGDFIILPSSTHEVLILPIDDMDSSELVSRAKEFTNMVLEVNESCVDEDQILSNHPYVYMKEDNRIVSMDDYVKAVKSELLLVDED